MYCRTMHVRRLRPEDLRIELASDGDDDAPGQLAQPRERTLEQIAGLQVEDRPERQVDDRAVRERPSQSAASESAESSAETDRKRWCSVTAGWPVAEARRKRRQDEVPVEHGEAGIGGKPVRCWRSFSGSTTRLLGTNDPARDAEDGCVRQPEPLGRDGRSEVDLVAHENVGNHSAHTARIESARSRAIRPANVLRMARASRSGSTARSGARSSADKRLDPPEAKAVKPAASIVGTIPSWPAKATTCPARSAARATGTSGRKWPVPPANVNRIRTGSSNQNPLERRPGRRAPISRPTGPSRAAPTPASSSSPSAPRRARRPRGCRGSARPCSWTRRAGAGAATCRGRRPP